MSFCEGCSAGAEIKVVAPNRMKESSALTTIVIANLVASILHFDDNIINFHEYPEAAWIPSPHCSKR